MRLEEGALPLEPRGQGDVVGVEAGDERSPRAPQRPVERDGEAGPGLPLRHEPRIAHAGQERGGAVGGAIVHHDQLEIRERLGEHARDRPGEPGGPVADTHEHGHHRHGHYPPPDRRRASRASTAAQ